MKISLNNHKKAPQGVEGTEAAVDTEAAVAIKTKAHSQTTQTSTNKLLAEREPAMSMMWGPGGLLDSHLFKPGEYKYETTVNGYITSVRPNNPKDGSNIVAKHPQGPGIMVNTDSATQFGRTLLEQCATVAHLASDTGEVVATFTPVRNTGFTHPFKRMANPLTLQSASAEVLSLRDIERSSQRRIPSQRQNQNQNQNQDRGRPQNQTHGEREQVLCILCNSV
jgi:hypothetical protein